MAPKLSCEVMLTKYTHKVHFFTNYKNRTPFNKKDKKITTDKVLPFYKNIRVPNCEVMYIKSNHSL